jgi:hypothetical protein
MHICLMLSVFRSVVPEIIIDIVKYLHSRVLFETLFITMTI